MEKRSTGGGLRVTIDGAADGMTLERYLRGRMGFTQAQIRRLKFRENGLCVNGERVRVSRLLHGGDVLEIRLEERAGSEHLEASAGPLEILYEDADLLAVWKEAGLVVHPAHGHYSDTLSNRVHAYFQQKGETVRVRSIGRLDKDTGGIVVFAKNQVAAARLWEQKETGIFKKEYLAVCEGTFPIRDGSIYLPISKAPGEKMKMCVSTDGAPAATHYHVLYQTEKRALLQVRIETGRTHQIRVHMASIGHALIGDVLYGAAKQEPPFPAGGFGRHTDGERQEYRGSTPCAEASAGTERTVPSGGLSILFQEGLQLCAWKAELRQPFSQERIVLSRGEKMQIETYFPHNCMVK